VKFRNGVRDANKKELEEYKKKSNLWFDISNPEKISEKDAISFYRVIKATNPFIFALH